MDRILIVLQADSWAHAAPCLKQAVSLAAASDRLSFGLCLREEPDKEELFAMRRYDHLRYLSPAEDVRTAMPALWQGERYVLQGTAALSFSRHWDLKLMRCLERCRQLRQEGAILTGWLPSPEDRLDAVCPVAVKCIGEKRDLHFQKGTPLHCAVAPQPAAFLHPSFIFGPSAFFRAAAVSADPPFLTAYARQWSVFTPDQPILHFLWPQPVSAEILPDTEAARRFCAFYGVDPDRRVLEAKAHMGLFSGDLRFPQYFPLMKRMREKWKHFINRNNPSKPLCITFRRQGDPAWKYVPDEQHRRFSWLAQLQDVQLLCYADAASLRKLQYEPVKLLEYQKKHSLPIHKVAAALPPDERPATDNFFAALLGVPFLLAHASETHLQYSHFIWMDFDYQGFPMYPKTSLDWEILCGDRVTIAMVSDRPDCTMIVIPQRLLASICSYVTTYCTVYLQQTGQLPNPTILWQEMIRDKEEWFNCVDMPAERQLFSLMLPSADVHA